MALVLSPRPYVPTLAMLAVLAACGGSARPSAPPAGAPSPDGGPRAVSGPSFDPVKLYQQMGLLARGAPMPFVGSISFLATPSADSTHMIVSLAITNSALTFAREGDRFKAGYTVGITLRDGALPVKQIEAHENVVVASYRETSRIDESVIFQELLTVKPGRYQLSLSVSDDGGSRQAGEEVSLNIPALGSGTLATPIAFARLQPRTSLETVPQLVASPAATATFGRDSIIGLYVEAYGPTTTPRLPIRVIISTDNGRPLFNDTLSIARRTAMYSGVVYIPVSRVGIGPATVAIVQPGRTDTVKTPIFVNFGEDLPVATFEEMINYLRWFAPPYRLKALKDTAVEYRAAAWNDFVKSTQSGLGTNDALHDYFRRLQLANSRYREESMPGWLTDRGKVLLGLGEPDQTQNSRTLDINTRNRTQIWEYRSLNLQLTFYDQTGFGRWRLTNSSDLEFMAAWRRRMQGQ
jgi:GWxTD domain-containing protein